jgi:hypothetical protein
MHIWFDGLPPSFPPVAAMLRPSHQDGSWTARLVVCGRGGLAPDLMCLAWNPQAPHEAPLLVKRPGGGPVARGRRLSGT